MLCTIFQHKLRLLYDRHVNIIHKSLLNLIETLYIGKLDHDLTSERKKN